MTHPLPEGTDSRVLNLYEKREKIYVRSIEGLYQNIRLYTGWPLLIGYFLCPWLVVDGHQAILFDLEERKFHIFWLTFWPQDFVLLGWSLMVSLPRSVFPTGLCHSAGGRQRPPAGNADPAMPLRWPER